MGIGFRRLKNALMATPKVGTRLYHSISPSLPLNYLLSRPSEGCDGGGRCEASILGEKGIRGQAICKYVAPPELDWRPARLSVVVPRKKKLCRLTSSAAAAHTVEVQSASCLESRWLFSSLLFFSFSRPCWAVVERVLLLETIPVPGRPCHTDTYLQPPIVQSRTSTNHRSLHGSPRS